MGEVEFNKDDEYKVKIVDGGEYKEPGGAIRKPTQEEIDAYKIPRIIAMVVFALVAVVLLLIVIIMIATVDRCEPKPKVEKLAWWKSGVVYKVYPRSFKDSNGDGVGDFKGIVEKLGYLKDLGIKILYLTSVFRIDKNGDYGYSVIDFKATNTEYGSTVDFKNLVDEAHKKGIKVVIEFFASDTSTQHQWFKDSRNISRNKGDWYVWSNGSRNVSGGVWRNDSGRFYLHEKGYPGKAYLNWDTEEVRKELESVLDFWLDEGVDGFHLVSLERLFGTSGEEDWDKIHTIVEKWNNYTTKKSPDSILISSSNPANLKPYGTKKNPELDIVVSSDLVFKGNMRNFYSAMSFKDIISNYLEEVSEGNWPGWVLSSSKDGRVGSNVSPKLAKSLQALVLTLPGTPVIIYGDEIGMKSVGNESQAPMQWNNSKNAGFTSNSYTWLGSVGNSSYTNAKDDPLGIKKIFTDALKLRSENESAFLGGNLSNFVVKSYKTVLAYTFKSDKSPQFVVALNFGTVESEVKLDELGAKGVLKLYTSDEKPPKINMKAVKVPGESLFIFEVPKSK